MYCAVKLLDQNALFEDIVELFDSVFYRLLLIYWIAWSFSVQALFRCEFKLYDFFQTLYLQ